ncbi:SGNH/GDSL hydrolase family protein [Bremerella sp. JC770]|uniref:SGNH/GDSL hydrolase family protein n=1 Tax=Bremerella sp. JC770 TaxID=3232137 RepID=UPI0034583D37
MILLVLPVAVHFLLYWITWSEQTPYGRLDQAVYLLIGCYLAVGVLLTFAPRVQAKYLLFCYALLFAFVLAEAVLSLLVSQPSRSAPWPPMHRTTLAADTMPGVEGNIEFTVSSLGIRGPDERDFEQSDVRILCVGGSTTECLYVTDVDSWPWRLQTLLSQQLGKNVFVGNAGRSGQFTPHHTFQIREYDLVSQFDRVVILCGINDMVRFLEGSYDRSRERVADEALTTGVEGLVYYRRLRLTEVIRTFFWQYVDQVGFVQDESGEWYAKARSERQTDIQKSGYQPLPERLDKALERYHRDVTELIAACRQRGVEPIFVTQPTLYEADLSPELESLLWMTKLEPATAASVMDAFNKTMQAVCESENVPCIDITPLLPQDTTVFYDDCHFNVAGCHKVASILSEHLEDELPSDAQHPKKVPAE